MSNIIDCLAAAPALMPMPGEAGANPPDKLPLPVAVDPPTQPSNATPAPSSTQSPSPRAPEGRQASRRRSHEVVAEAQGDVDAFVRDLDQKRRQLDDQIHKFIAQKEREFKLYERELRTRYRTPSTPPQTPAAASSTPTATHDKPADATPANETSGNTTEKAHERETELLGLFTPAYLPLLDGRPSGPARSPSAPALTDSAESTAIAPDRQALQRANTDPALEKKPSSIRLGLGPRTPSSGSDPGRNLVSALRSPSAGPRLSNKKRVSLIVGDEVVAPSDNVFSGADKGSEQPTDRPSDAQQPKVQAPPPPDKLEQIRQPPELDTTGFNPPQSPRSSTQPGGLSLGLASAARDFRPSKVPSPTKNNVDGDLELASPFSMDEEFDRPLSPDTTQIEDIDADFDSGLDSESTLRAPSPSSPIHQDMSSAGQSPSFDIPFPSFEASSSSSAQPISPGFSRPSVREDPQFGASFQKSEELPVQGSLYGSFSRPSYSKQQTSGSLGESFMAKNAEQLMRRRQSASRS